MGLQGSRRKHGITTPKPSLLSIGTRRGGTSHETDDEPLSPGARVVQDLHIIMVIGLAAPIDIGKFRAGLEATLVQHPRFSSIRVMKRTPRWVRTVVNLDDHVILPGLDPSIASVNSDELHENYLASLSTLPMDNSRPLWDVHVLDFPTTEAAASLAFRIHHAIGDGMSIISLFVVCAGSAAFPDTDQLKPKVLQPSPPPARRRKRPIGGLPLRAAKPAGALGFIAWALSCVLFAWNSVVDVARLIAVLLLGDKQTVFKGVKGVEFRRKRFVSRSLSFADVKHVKNALNCTVNDVLLGVASAALSRYYFRKHGDRSAKKGCLHVRFVVPADMRPTPGIQKLDNMMDPRTHNDAKWGNRFSLMVLPFHIASHEDPLDYVRQAKKSADRKKKSLEAVFIQKISRLIIQMFWNKISVAIFHRITSNITAISSNLTGPTEQLELFGNKVLYMAPSVYGHPQALTIHWLSYVDVIRVVLAVDDWQFPDSHQLLDDFVEALKTIKDSS